MNKKTSNRKSIPKSIRFEVLKRDSFSCQYCGASAPNVVLHVDHIQPVSKGGDNDIMNLVTGDADGLIDMAKNVSSWAAFKREIEDLVTQLEESCEALS